jgi:hypothetical protein
MKTKKKSLILLFTLLLIGNSFNNNCLQAQTDTIPYVSHYVLPDFIVGSVKMKNGGMEYAYMNYNMITEEMIFDKDGTKLALAELEAIDTVYIDSLVFVPHEKIFFEILYSGNVVLYKQNKCNLLIAGDPAGYGGSTETGASKNVANISGMGRAYKLKLPADYHITDASQFWIEKEGKLLKASTVHQVMKVFPDKSNEIKQLSRQKEFDIKKNENIISIVRKCSEPSH